MSAQARINGSKFAFYSPRNAGNVGQLFWQFDRSNLENEMCNEHYFSPCLCRPGQRLAMELERRLGRCSRARLPHGNVRWVLRIYAQAAGFKLSTSAI